MGAAFLLIGEYEYADACFNHRVALANILRRSRVNQSRVLPRRRTACGRCVYSWLRASAVASEEAGVSSTEAANGLDEIGLDVLTPRRSFNRLIKGAHSLPELRVLIMEHALDFDAVNISHAFGRVAKHYRNATTRAGLRAHQPIDDRKWSQLHEAAIPAVQKLCEQLPRLVHDMEAWDVAQSLWALSVLDCYDRRVFEMLTQRGGQIAALLKPTDCCMIMLAFGRFGHYSPELIKYIPQVMLQELDKAKPVEVSNVLWGLAKLSLPATNGSKVFLEAICDHMLWTMDQYGCEELTRSLWSFASLSHYPGKRFLWTAESQLLERVALMTPQDVGNVLWSFGRFKYKPTRLLDELPLHIGRRLSEFKPQELSCLLYGYTQSRHYHASLLDAAAPLIMIRAPQMSHQDLVIAIWCYGIFGHKPLLTGPAVAAALHNLAPHNPSSHANHQSPPSSSSSSSSSSSPLTSASNNVSSTPSSSTSRSHSTLPINHPLAAAVASSSSPSSSSGLSSFIDALGSVIFRRLPGLRPVGLSNVIKALGGLKAPTKPEIQALAREAAAIASSRIHDFKLLEISNLLYGLSLMQYNDHAIYQQCVQQSIRILEQRQAPGQRQGPGHKTSDQLPSSGLLRGEEGWMVRNQSWNDRAPVDFSPGQLREDEVNEDPGPSSSPPSSVYRPRAFDHKTINSIVASCVSVGLTPSDLVEVAEMKGLRVRDPSSYRKVSRWQQGHPHFSSSKWAVRKGPTVPGAVARPPSPHINGEAISHEQGRPGSRGVRNVSRSNGYHAAKSDDQNYGSVGLVDINGAALKVHLTPPHSHSHAAAAAVSPTDS